MKSETEEKYKFPVFKTVGVCAMAAALAVGVLMRMNYKKEKSSKPLLQHKREGRRTGKSNTGKRYTG